MAMTEKEAIRLINAYLEIDYSRIPEMTVEKFDEAMTMMMESFEKNQWIPVTEKLPDDQGMVLVSCRNKKGLNSINRAYYWDASIIDVHPDEQLKQTINNRVEALQKKQQAQAEQETAKVEAQTALIKAQNEAEIAITKAKAEAEANKVKAARITPELIQMKEAEARYKHGWVTVQGVETVVKDK